MSDSDTPRTDAVCSPGYYSLIATLARQLERELTQAQARCAEVEKDAARYRWLRSQDWNTGRLFVVAQPTEIRLGTDCPSRDRLDAAIDEAMAAR